MAEIESRDESQALQMASDAMDRHMDSYDRELFREGWLAGRDWARNPEMLAQIEENRARVAEEERLAEIRERRERHELVMHPERNPSSIFYDPEAR